MHKTLIKIALGFGLFFTQAAFAQTNADLQRLVSWFAGEWDNHEQVWQQKT